jgi:hypothetical protein
MSALGKILALLNVFAALLFTAVLVFDYGPRKNWSFVNWRWGLTREGLPTDDKETDAHGDKGVDAFKDPQFGQPTLKKYNLGANLDTQEKEFNRVKTEIQNKVGSADPVQVRVGKDTVTLTTKLQKLAWVLRPLANTFARHDILTRLMTSPQPSADPRQFDFTKLVTPVGGKDAAAGGESQRLATLQLSLKGKEPAQVRAALETELQKDLDNAFAQVAPSLSGTAKRAAIAHVLLGMCEVFKDLEQLPEGKTVLDSKAYRRTLDVIGLQAAVHELDARAGVMEEMAYEVERLVAQARDGFILAYERAAEAPRAEKLAMDRAKSVHALKESELQNQRDIRAKQKDAVDELNRLLAQARAKTNDLLTKQADQEGRILDQRMKIADVSKKNQALETRLRELEKKAR